MIDYLAWMTPEAMPDTGLQVEVTKTPAVWTDPDPETGAAELLTPAEMLPGPWALIPRDVVDKALWSDTETVAEIDRATGRMLRCREPGLVGCTISPQWAGSPCLPLAMAEPVPATIRPYQTAISAHIEATARARQYDSALSIATYVVSSVPGWAAEARAFVEWRDAVWFHVLVELAKVQAGEREAPTIEALIAELPEIAWP